MCADLEVQAPAQWGARDRVHWAVHPQADSTEQKAIIQPDSNTSHLQSTTSRYIALDDVLSAIELNKDIVTGIIVFPGVIPLLPDRIPRGQQ